MCVFAVQMMQAADPGSTYTTPQFCRFRDVDAKSVQLGPALCVLFLVSCHRVADPGCGGGCSMLAGRGDGCGDRS
jgi:hypothetical protein